MRRVRQLTMTNPIRPSEIVKHKATVIPDKVIEAFNHIITVNYMDGRSHFAQEAVVAIMEREGLSRSDIFANKYLDVEDIYRAAGWKVEYDKPGYNESGRATFTFKVAAGCER
jgi:hypothetical protein